MNEQLNRINYSEDNLKKGVEVPDTFITVGATDTYKLLEALNIDWKKINVPNLKKITRWNSVSGVNPIPEETFTDYINQVKGVTVNPINNSVDWLNNEYDYLSDGLNTNYLKTFLNNSVGEDGKINDVTRLIPEWSKSGVINDSKDIADILNYLTWRVITLDHFTTHWNKRNAEKTIQNDVLYFHKDYESLIEEYNSRLDESATKLTYTKTTGEYDYVSVSFSEIGIELKANLNRSDLISINSSNNLNKELYDIFAENNISENLLSAIKSTSPIEISISQNTFIEENTLEKFPDHIRWFGSEDTPYNIQFETEEEDNIKNYFLFNLNFGVKGTGNYKVVHTSDNKGWLDKISQNIYDCTYLDPAQKEVNIAYKQSAGEFQSTSYADSDEKNIKITITKEDNSFNNNGFIFGNKLITTENSTSSDWYGDVGSSKNIKYGKLVRGTNIQLPYYIDDETAVNKYQINFNLKYGDEYGIRPYFFIGSNGGTITLGENNLFQEFNSENYGKIILENNKYYYIPPVQSSETDTQFTFYAVFYYNDSEPARQITPLCLSFNVKLNAEVRNRFIFLENGLNIIQDYSGTNYQINCDVKWALNDGINIVNNNTENGVSYCIRTIEYQEQLGIENLPYNISFDDFVIQYCNKDKQRYNEANKYNVEYLGLVEPNTNDRIIDIVNKKINDTIEIYENSELHIGDIGDKKSFYYTIDDSYRNYNVDDELLNYISNIDITDSNTLNNEPVIADEEGKFIIEVDDDVKEDNSRKFLYEIKQSTAKYPTQNGIFDNEGTFVDADNDYYYLVFRLSSDRGSLSTVSYTAAVGYYILRVVRKNLEYNLNLKDTNESEIKYSDSFSNEKSFRLMPRIPIYLNRLFNESSARLLGDIDGNLHWDFFGIEDNGTTSTKWDDTVVSIKNKNTDEEYIKIYNEGDTYKVKEYNPSENAGKINTSSSFIPENNEIITEDATVERVVGKYNTSDPNTGITNSGSILFINKLMKNIGEEDSPEYSKVESDYVKFTLSLSIGNSTNYIRRNIPLPFTFNVYKRTYDFRLYERTSATVVNVLKYTNNNPRVIQSQPMIGQGILNGTSLLNYTNRANIYIGSNEYGTNSESQDIEMNDQVKIKLDESTQNKPKIELDNIFMNKTLVGIGLNSLDVNADNWCAIDELQLNNTNYIYNVALFTNLSENYNNILYILPFESSGQSVKELRIKINGDDDGIYKDKELITYFSFN